MGVAVGTGNVIRRGPLDEFYNWYIAGGAILLAAASCKQCSAPTGALAVGSISVSEAGLAGKPDIGESNENLRKELAQDLEATGRFTMRPGGPGQGRLEIDKAPRTPAPVPLGAEGQPAPPQREVAEGG